MPTQFAGRVALILFVVLGALWMIFPGAIKGRLKPDLKPGIDMVGGTSLLYEIKQPQGGWNDVKPLSEVVMESLKKRVDPSGVRNLIWRPQGNTRLEIQMPLTERSGQATLRKNEFLDAQKKLNATNVRVLEVISAVEDMKGNERAAKLKQLAMDSQTRIKLFDQLAQTWDQMQAARASKNAAAEAEASNKYDELKTQIGQTNTTPQQLQELLDSKENKQQKVDQLKAGFADFPQRVAAIDDFQKKYEEYAKLKGAIDDAGELKRLLRGSGVLEFHILATPPQFARRADEVTISWEEYQAMADRLKQDGPQVRGGDSTKWYLVDDSKQFGHRTETYNDKHYVLAFTTREMSLMNRPGLTPWGLKRAGPENSDANRKVAFEFDASGATLFGDLTGNNVNKALGIVLDDKMISAPNINQQIHGNGVITGGSGGFSKSEQNYLINTLNAGSLPAQLTDEPISERTVGPQLGADNLRAGLIACMVGLVVVAIFLVGYYYLAGVVAFIAVLINLVLILGVMSMLNATFTLPGVAGIVLAIGAAVDANVLIFERLREEQHRGLGIKMALRNSYDRAWSAILDSNMTTVITSAILYWLGTEEVKGFGITLLIGLCSSMFTALFVTKTIFGILIEKFGITDLSSLPRTFPKWDQMLQPKVDWISKVWIFVAISAVTIVIGCGAFLHYGKKGELLDIEFASGTSVTFELKEPMKIEDVRSLFPLENKEIPSPAIVSVGNDNRTYEIVTTSQNSKSVQAAVLAALGPQRLKLELPSNYEQVNAAAADVADKLIFPVRRDRIEDIKKAANGFLPGNWQTYREGAAIVLKNIDPPLKPEQILDRLRRQSIAPGQQTAQTYRDYAVESPDGPDEPAKLAVVLVSDINFPYEQDAAKWREELVTPTWKLIAEAVNKPATLQKVNSFDAQVAGDTARDALLALVLSIVVIMAYIWLRFGNLKYGTATTIAMIHDTALVLAAIGLSHLIYHAAPAVAHALLLEPFRLNITTVAAILTVMSYSMIDTIVVFDRVRENRGKFGHLDRKVINDSINQTMSRTLLTAGTNIVTLFFMYVFGGPGIHGFTFVLLFGILIGTYSSVAIAAPILLIGRDKRAAMPAGAAVRKPAVAGQLQRA